MRGLKSTLFLLVVLVGLGAYIYFVASKPKEPADAKQEKVFASIALDQINELRVKSQSGDVTSLKKDGETWQIVAPLTEKAAESEVSNITSALEQVDVARVLDENPATVTEFGLDTPKIEVEYKSSDGKSGKLLLGEKNATGGNVYARRNDEKRVFLIPAYHEATFNKSTFDLRDKTLMTIARDKVDSIEVTAGGDTVALTRAGDDWKLTRPLAARADSSMVIGLISRVESSQMKSIVTTEATPADLKKYGLDKPSVSVTLNLGSAKAILLLGAKSGDDAVYARDASKPTVVTVEKAMADDLTKKVDDYRRKDVFESRAFNITHVELSGGGKTLAFDRVKGKDETAPDTFRKTGTTTDLDKEKVESLLTGLADIRAMSFTPTRSGTGLDAPALTISVKFDDGKKEEKVLFGKSGQDAYAGTNDPGAAKIDATKLDDALKTFQELTK
jgi:hypothetical protein